MEVFFSVSRHSIIVPLAALSQILSTESDQDTCVDLEVTRGNSVSLVFLKTRSKYIGDVNSIIVSTSEY
jgi:hypothetical protein